MTSPSSNLSDEETREYRAPEVHAGERYRHFEGEVIEIVSSARHALTRELYVVYRCPRHNITVLSYYDFFRQVHDKLKRIVPRFTKLP